MSHPDGGAAASFPVAELERRFYAFALDRLLVWSLCAGLGTVAWLVLGHDRVWRLVGVVAAIALVLFLVLAAVVGLAGLSPGKAAVGLRVVHEGTGNPIGVGHALLRSLVLAISTLPTAGIGLATLAWTAVEDRGRQRRGWHDHLARSVVVDVRPVLEEVAQVAEGPRHIVNLTALRLVPAPAVPDEPTPARAPADTQTPSTTTGSHVARPTPTGPQQVMRPGPAAPAHPPPVPPAPPAQPTAWPQPGPGGPDPAAPGGPQRFGWGSGAPTVMPGAGPPSGPSPAYAPAAPAPAPVEEDGRTVVRSRGPTRARWRITFDTGDSFVVEGPVLVGRRPEPRSGEPVRHLVPLPSSDMSVSKTHAQIGISAEDGALVVADRGSTNGSHLVRQGVTRELPPGKPTTLLPGDRVRFGDREMTVARDG